MADLNEEEFVTKIKKLEKEIKKLEKEINSNDRLEEDKKVKIGSEFLRAMSTVSMNK